MASVAEAPGGASGKLVVVSGRSGSGKSTALHVLEDAGFYCIDNLPAFLLPQLFTPGEGRAALVRTAVSIDARNMPRAIWRFDAILAELPPGLEVEVLYLDADDATLIKRFSETRRKHPLSSAGMPLSEALEAERVLLSPIAARASRVIDTRAMSLHDLRDLVMKTVAALPGSGMAVLLQSFGFKQGVPLDADLVFDLRSLPNPHWVPQLREQTGRDAGVAEFLAESTDVSEMLDDIERFLRRWLPRFASSNRSYASVALGCTGGRHRSVYVAEQLHARLLRAFPGAQLRHRELGTEGRP
jgi:UPF0042 nucleotide-binding protein